MPLLPRPPVALLRIDAFTATRPGTATDAEGDPSGSSGVPPGLPAFPRGTLLRVSATEQLLAQQRGTNVDKALAVVLGMPLDEGDWVTVGGSTYEVVTAEDRRLYRRLLLRKR